MKKKVLTLLCCLLSLNALMAQSVVKESLSFKSKLLKQDVYYSIYLPDGYETSNRSYPVLYLLHGWSDDETAWVQTGNMQAIVDDAIAEGKAVDMIVVMPRGEITWYVNSFDGKVPYEDMFFEELIPYIEKTYRTRTKAEFRAISGLSMGGYGSLLYCMHRPEYFSVCAPMSAAIYTDEELRGFPDGVWGNNFDEVYGARDVTETWEKNCILRLVEKCDPEKVKHIQFYLQCGDDDALLDCNFKLYQAMRDKGICHEFRVADGWHCWPYWRSAFSIVLEQVSKAFTRS